MKLEIALRIANTVALFLIAIIAYGIWNDVSNLRYQTNSIRECLYDGEGGFFGKPCLNGRPNQS